MSRLFVVIRFESDSTLSITLRRRENRDIYIVPSSFSFSILFFSLSLFQLYIDTSCPTHYQLRRRIVTTHRLLALLHHYRHHHHHHQDLIHIRAIYRCLQPLFYIIYPLHLLLKNWIFTYLLVHHFMD